jgi:hypothetical protein
VRFLQSYITSLQLTRWPNVSQFIWNCAVPSKIHVFLWFVLHDTIFSRDKLGRCNHVSVLTCVFCSEMLYACLAQLVWTRLLKLIQLTMGDDIFSISSLALNLFVLLTSVPIC